MERINVSEFKATCLRLIERVKRGGAGVLILKNGEPAAMLVPPVIQTGKVQIGSLSNEFEIVGDIVSSIVDEDTWEALK